MTSRSVWPRGRLAAAAISLATGVAVLPATLGALSASADSCPAGTTVTTSAQLLAALKAATPGTVIDLAPGTYSGKLTTSASGTPTNPITLCGPSTAVIDGGTSSHALSFLKASWWVVSGFQIQHGNKGLDLMTSSDNVFSGLYIHNTTGAGVHVSSFSTDNTFNGLLIRSVGAEGYYIGSAQGNWCQYSGCKPDASDRNVIENTDVAGSVSDPIDLKEGTTGGSVLNSVFNGTGMKAKTWVNIKGNSYTVSGNVGTNSPKDGFEVHEILPGWGNYNVLSANQANVNGTGYGYYVQPGTIGNHVLCDNTFTAAALGFGNVVCG